MGYVQHVRFGDYVRGGQKNAGGFIRRGLCPYTQFNVGPVSIQLQDRSTMTKDFTNYLPQRLL